MLCGKRNETYKLKYFPLRNLAEPARMILHYVNQPFEDIRIQLSEWPTHKPSAPFGTLPLLELSNGQTLNQSHTITKYLARKFGMGGKDNMAQAKLDEIADFHKDVMKTFSAYTYVKTGFIPGNTEKLFNEVFLPTIEKYFPVYERLLTKDTKTRFFANSPTPTYVDFMVADFMFTIKGFHPDGLKNWPTITNYIDKIFNLPQLKNYIATRPVTPI